MIPKNAGAKRGAVVVETAIVVGTVLTLILFSVQIGVLGFLQVTVDAASFVNARGYALGDTNPNGETSQIFSQVTNGDIVNVSMPAPQPSATVPVDYGYNSTNATEKANSYTQRHGGSTTIQPTLYQSTVNKGGTTGIMKLFNRQVGVNGVAQEPYYKECGAHYNVSNSASSCGASTAPSNFQVDYFKNGENTPPYYVGFNYLEHCNSRQPWTTCGAMDFDFLSLGVGEYLDVDNWGITTGGVSGGAYASTFQQMACHQRTYAKLATFFAGYSDLLALYKTYETTINVQMAANVTDFSAYVGLGPVASPLIDQVYAWDRHVQQGYAPGNETEPILYKMSPEAGC